MHGADYFTLGLEGRLEPKWQPGPILPKLFFPHCFLNIFQVECYQKRYINIVGLPSNIFFFYAHLSFYKLCHINKNSPFFNGCMVLHCMAEL